jgi:hypothetical protein
VIFSAIYGTRMGHTATKRDRYKAVALGQAPPMGSSRRTSNPLPFCLRCVGHSDVFGSVQEKTRDIFGDIWLSHGPCSDQAGQPRGCSFGSGSSKGFFTKDKQPPTLLPSMRGCSEPFRTGPRRKHVIFSAIYGSRMGHAATKRDSQVAVALGQPPPNPPQRRTSDPLPFCLRYVGRLAVFGPVKGENS